MSKAVRNWALSMLCVFAMSACSSGPAEVASTVALDRVPAAVVQDECAEAKAPIVAADNASIRSEWGHVNIAGGVGGAFIRIVKNQEKAGYAVWYCRGAKPAEMGSVRAYTDSSECWALGDQKFYAKATDGVLKKCGLLDALEKAGVVAPKIRPWSTYPLQFEASTLGRQGACTVAVNAFKNCIK